MLDRNNLVALMKQVAKADPSAPVAYSYGGKSLTYEDLNETLRNELNELAGNYSLYRENKNLIFQMIEETLDEVVPKRVSENYSQFAEVKTFGQGDKPIFRRKISGTNRAKQFITAVALSGVYESFRLDKNTFELGGRAIGGAAYIDFERFLNGDEDWADYSQCCILPHLHEH